MSDTVLPLLKQAFQYGNDCYMAFDGIIDRLEKTLEALPEEDTQIRTLTTQLVEKTFAMQDILRPYLEELRDVRLKYRAVYIPTEISPEVDELVEVLARIEARRRGIKPA